MKMLESIFSAEDMFYCSVPVPPINAHKDPDYTFDFTAAQQADYGQSQTHPSIIYVPNGWNGHKYWLASTPYPKGMGVFENPCIYYGDEDNDGNPPRIFTPISGVSDGIYTIINNPVVKVKSNSQINSDPDLYFDAEGNGGNGIMYLLSRFNSVVPQRAYIQKSISGQAWTKRDDNAYMEGLSQPSMIKVGEDVLILGLQVADYKYNPSSGYINANSRGLVKIWSGNPENVASFTQNKGYLYFNGKLAIGPYHADFFKDESTGKYYMIAACTDHELPAPYSNSSRYSIFLAESDDGYNYYLFARPLLAPCSKCSNYYRPTAFIRQSDRTLVVYWSTVAGIINEADQFPNGASDIPVDNRTIGLSYGNFDVILAQLKKDFVTNRMD